MLDEKDLQALKTGWKLGFGDDDEFVDRFFARYDSDDTRAVVRNDAGDIVAQMHCFIFDDEVCGAQGCYIYGVTTLPEYRGKGLAAGMIKDVLRRLKEKGVAYAVLIAEEPSLQRLYNGLGFVQRPQIIEVRGKNDDMNFAMDEVSLNLGVYYVLNPAITKFTEKILIMEI